MKYFEIIAFLLLCQFWVTVANVFLKICNIISWSWAWVFAPIWLPPLAVFLFFLFMFTIGVFFGLAGIGRKSTSGGEKPE